MPYPIRLIRSLHGRVAALAIAVLCLACGVGAADPSPPAAPSAAPVLLSPIDGEEITDVASYFQWLPVAGCAEFEVQVARDAEFRDVLCTRHTTNKGFHKNLYFPKDPLPAGAYFWRVRAAPAAGPGPWSVVRSLRVNADHPVRPAVVRAVGPKTPLFLMRSRTWDPIRFPGNVAEIIPPGLGHVIVVDDLAMASERVIERAKKYEQLGLDFVVWNNRCQVSLATIEYCFQNFGHCIGTAEGEHFSGMDWERGPEGNLSENDFVHRAWALCGKYGRFYFFADGDGGSYRWPDFARRAKDELARYRRNIVPMFKTTIGDVALHSYGAVEGLMASGYVENTGTWDDEWIWPICGFGKLGETIPDEKVWQTRRTLGTRQCPWVYDVQMWLMGIASGSTVFHLESAHQWTPQGRAAPQYRRVFLPFVRAVAEHELIPSRQAFLDQIEVAVESSPDLQKGKHGKQYTGAFAYLGDLYALRDRGDREFIPNDSRYGIVCLLPPGATCLNKATRVLPQEQAADPAKARELFDAAYPRRFGGDAFMWECDGSVIVTNSNENRDVDQRFDLPLPAGPVHRLSGTVGVHQYLVGKVENHGGRLWLQANGEYPDRHTDLTLTCPHKPQWRATPPEGADVRWDDAAGALTVRLSYADGAVEVAVEPTESTPSTQPAAAARVAPDLDLSAMIQPVPATAVFSEPDYDVWCGTMVRGDDGKCHLFYSRWPRKLTHQAWVTHSEVAHAVADGPFGPYKPAGVALPARGREFWDGLCTHNPTVLRSGGAGGGKYYLYYMGDTGDGVVQHPLNWTHRNNQRIGVAVADKPEGPWKRFDKPLIDVSPDEDAPDALMVSNPAVCRRPDGTFLMVYKAVGKKDKLPGGGPVVHLTATAKDPTGPFTKQLKPIFTKAGVKFPAEDPFIWYGGDRYYAIVKDNAGYFTGAGYSLALFQSADGLDWGPARHVLVTSPKGLKWADGQGRPLTALERPQLHFEHGRPAALLCAAADRADRDGSFNVQIPLKAADVGR